ncbi:MAG: hypothetical protein GY842_06965, partial [bacterium]|nr:hypothetical protein [bacterium]
MNRPSAWMSAVLVAATTVLGAEVSSRAEAPPGAEAIAEAVGRARAWSGVFASEEVLEPFAPSVDLRYREYRTPRPLRAWIARIDLAAPGVRLVVTEPADLPDEDGSLRETRCADTLQFARQRGVQLAFNASAFAPFRKRMGQPMDVVGLAAFRGETYSSPDERFGAMYVRRD